jgi:hypothetical protein
MKILSNISIYLERKMFVSSLCSCDRLSDCSRACLPVCLAVTVRVGVKKPKMDTRRLSLSRTNTRAKTRFIWEVGEGPGVGQM